MHARINYVDIKPENFDEVDDFWRDVVQGYAGLVRGYFLRDGDTAHTVSVVVFESESVMVDNTEQQLGDVVRRAAEHRLNEPELHPLEVCANVSPVNDTGEIGHARVVDVTLKGGIERAIRELVPFVGAIMDTTDHASGHNPYYSPSK